MAACDAHDTVWGSPKELSQGEGYLLAARFVQRSVIQERFIDTSMKLMEGMGLAMSRDECKLQIESQQGATPWIICEQCIDFLKLNKSDKDAAKQAATKWWHDKSTPGHVPGKRVTKRYKKPACFMIFGSGFTPSEEQAKSVTLAWLDKRKKLLGKDAVVGIRSELIGRPQASRMEFVKVVSEVQEKHPGQATDDIILLDQRTGKDIAFVAIWAPEDSDYAKSLLKQGVERQRRSEELGSLPQKRWWQFWRRGSLSGD